MRISDWSSDVCSSDLVRGRLIGRQESVDARSQHGGVTADKPIFVCRFANEHLPVETQLGQELAPAFGDGLLDDGQVENPGLNPFRSEARRVGKECVSTCRCRWSPLHDKKKRKK